MPPAGFACGCPPGCRGVFVDQGSGFAAGFGHGALGIVDHELFAKGINEKTGTPCDEDSVGRHRGKLNRVADDGPPKSAVGV